MSGSPVVPDRPPSSVRLALTLALAGLLSGLVLVFVYQGTLPRIQANRAARLTRAVYTVLPGTERIEPLLHVDGSWTEGGSGPGEASIYAGYDAEGSLVGYALPGEGPGFQDVIQILIGYVPGRRRVVGMEVLQSRETPGLGDKIYKDEAFVGAFRDLEVDPEAVVVMEPTGAPHEVDAITGATISSKAVVKIMNEAVGSWRERLPEAGDKTEAGTVPDAKREGTP